MKILLSPAKSFNSSAPINFDQQLKGKFNTPFFIDESKYLISLLKLINKEELKSMMNISDKIAELNINRYHQWQPTSTKNNNPIGTPCLFYFNGDAYKSLEVNSLNEKEVLFLQDHLLILSGLYGILKPMDLILPYRLEMGIPLSNNKGKNLYFFWQEKIKKYFENIREEVIINLASNEYFQAINHKKIKQKVYSIFFQNYHRGTYKTIGILAKKARGKIVNYIAKNQLESVENLKSFKEDGYQFSQEKSDKTNLVFLKK